VRSTLLKYKNAKAEKQSKNRVAVNRKNGAHEMLKNSVKIGVSKIVKNVKFYLLKFYFA